ncbi:MAG: hypothetical protein ACWGQW_02175 [bacterium]
MGDKEERLKRAQALLNSGTLSPEKAQKLQAMLQEYSPASAAPTETQSTPSLPGHEDPSPAPEPKGVFETVGEYFGYEPEPMTPVEPVDEPDEKPASYYRPPAGNKNLELEAQHVQALASAAAPSIPSTMSSLSMSPLAMPGSLPTTQQQAIAPELTKTAFYFEPGYEMARRFWERDVNHPARRKEALQEMEENKDNYQESEWYQKAADLMYMKFYDRAMKNGEIVYRPKKMIESDAKSALMKQFGDLVPYGEAYYSGIDDMMALGLTRQGTGALPMSETERQLVEEGWIEDRPERIKRMAAEHPWVHGLGVATPLVVGLATGTSGAILPMRAMAPAARSAMAAEGFLGKTAAGIAKGAPIGAGLEAGRSLIESTGERLRGQDVSTGEQLERAAVSGIAGGITEGLGTIAGEAVGSTGKALYNWLGGLSTIGKHIRNIRAAGGTGMTKAPATRVHYKQMYKESDPAQAVVHVEDAPNVSLPKMRRMVLEFLQEDVDDALAQMKIDNDKWYEKLQYAVVKTKPVADAIKNLFEAKTGGRIAALESVDDIKKDIFPGVNNEYLFKTYKYLQAHPEAGVRQLDDWIEQIDYKASTAIAPDDATDRGIKAIQSAIRKVRDQLPNGYKKMKDSHHHTYEEIRNTKARLGIKDDFKPGNEAQQLAVERVILKDQAPLKKYSSQMEKLRRQNPQLEKNLRETAGTVGQYYLGASPTVTTRGRFFTSKLAGMGDVTFNLLNQMSGRGTYGGRAIGTMSPDPNYGTAADRHARQIMKIPQEDIDDVLRLLEQ